MTWMRNEKTTVLVLWEIAGYLYLLRRLASFAFTFSHSDQGGGNVLAGRLKLALRIEGIVETTGNKNKIAIAVLERDSEPKRPVGRPMVCVSLASSGQCLLQQQRV